MGPSTFSSRQSQREQFSVIARHGIKFQTHREAARTDTCGQNQTCHTRATAKRNVTAHRDIQRDFLAADINFHLLPDLWRRDQNRGSSNRDNAVPLKVVANRLAQQFSLSQEGFHIPLALAY